MKRKELEGRTMSVDESLLAMLKISKFEQQVSIVLKGSQGKKEEAVLFLCEYSPFHPGPETVDELLNQGGAFIPVRYRHGAFRVVNLNKILYVEVEDFSNKEVNMNLRIYFEEDIHIDAAMYEPLPERYGRTLDFFNTPKSFLPLLCGSKRVYVNKKNVITVEELNDV